MNKQREKETKTIKKENTRPEPMKFRCVLYGSKVCEHPECTGYDNRMCDAWARHSSK